MKLTDIIVDRLENLKVKYVFGIPGTHIYHLFRSLENSKIKIIISRHEQNAVYMADIYGRLTGEAGVAIVTAGPGILNGFTGIGQAFSESSPLLYITGETSSEGYYEFHGLDNPLQISKALENITKSSYIIFDPDFADWSINLGYNLSLYGRRGPIHIAIPHDVIGLESSNPVTTDFKREYTGDIGIFENIVKRYLDNSKILFLIGSEGAYSDIQNRIIDVISKNNLCHASYPSTIGFIPQDIGLYAGYIDKSHLIYPPFREALKDIDVIIGWGVRPESPEALYIKRINNEIRWIYILPSIYTRVGFKEYSEQYDIRIIGKDLVIYGDLGRIIDIFRDIEYKKYTYDINNMVEERLDKLYNDIEGKLNRKPIHQGVIAYKISENISKDTLLILDTGGNELWMREYIAPKNSIRYLYAGGFGTLGYSFGSSIGGYLSGRYNKVVSITGDGSFLMSIMELQTVYQYNIPIKIIVVNDGEYGILTHLSKMELGTEIYAELGRLDFSKIAKDFGVEGLKIDDPRDLDMIKDIINSKGPILLDIWTTSKDKPSLLNLL